MIFNRREIGLDLMRGCAALLVCANHLRAATVASYENISEASVLLKAFYAVTSLGHQAVIVFFVLSGFFVGGSLLAKGTEFSWKEYIAARLTRLWVVLVPALLLTATIDLVLQHEAPNVLTGAYENIWHMGPRPSGVYSLSAWTFFGNLLFLQQIFLPVFGSNDPLWSLAYEFWYYVMFPLLLVSGNKLGMNSLLVRLLALLVVVCIIAFLPTSGRVGFLCWLGGVMAYVMRTRYPSFNISVLHGLCIFVAGMGISRFLGKAEFSATVSDLIMASVAIIFVVSLASKSKKLHFSRSVSWLAYHLSEMSYSLYLIHFPLVLCIGGIAFSGEINNPDTIGLMKYSGWLFSLLAVSWGFWYLFERRTYQIRHIMLCLISRTAK